MSDQRDRILACACDLYLADGLDGFSMRKLARAIGVTAPALYRHYESRDRVLLDVVGEAYKRMAQYLYRALEGRTPEERFFLAGKGYLSFALEHPRYYEVLFDAPRFMGLTEVPPEVEAQACAIGQFWDDRVRECMAAGLLAERDPRSVGLTLWGHAHGLISLYLRGMIGVDEATFGELYRSSAQRLLAGLGSMELRERLEREETEPAERASGEAPTGRRVRSGASAPLSP